MAARFPYSLWLYDRAAERRVVEVPLRVGEQLSGWRRLAADELVVDKPLRVDALVLLNRRGEQQADVRMLDRAINAIEGDTIRVEYDVVVPEHTTAGVM